MDTPFPAYDGDKPYVFVCYAHANADVVYPEITWLHEQGINIWYDEGIEAGSVWRQSLTQAIAGASKMVYYISDESVASVHCNQEVGFAADKGIDVLPVYLQDTQLPPELQLVLNRVQALHRSDGANYPQQIVQALGATSTNKPTAAFAQKGRDQQKPSRSRWQALVALTALICLAGVWYWSSRPQLAPSPANNEPVAEQVIATENSVGVAPPRVLGVDPNLVLFAEIVEQDTKDALVGQGNITLVHPDAPSTPRYLIRSNVRTTNDVIRLSIELTRTRDETILWSEVYEEPLKSDDMMFQRAAHVAFTVNSIIRNSNYRQYLEGYGVSNNQQALNAFFAGLAENDAARLGDGNFRVAVSHLREAIALDPEFTDAYGMLAMIFAFRGQGELTVDEAVSNIEALLPKFSSLKPSPALPFSLVWVRLRLYLDYEQAETYLAQTKAASFYPPSQTELLACSIKWGQGKLGEALTHCRAAADNSGTSLDFFTLANLLHFAGRFDEAIIAFERSLEITDNSQNNVENGIHDNNGFQLLDVLARSHALAGQFDKANAVIDSSRAREFGRYPKKYAASLALLGRAEEAQQALTLLENAYHQGERIEPNQLFWTNYYLGDREKTMYWLNKVIEARDVFTIGSFKGSPLLEDLRDDPKGIEQMKRLLEIESTLSLRAR